MLEYCPYDLERMVLDSNGLRNDEAIRLVVHMLNALVFMASNSILHRYTYLNIFALSVCFYTCCHIFNLLIKISLGSDRR